MSKKKIIIIAIVLIAVILGIIGVTKLNTKKNNGKEISQLTKTEKESYSSEINLVNDFLNNYDVVKANEEAAEQIVKFAHENGIGKVINIDGYGTKDFNEDGNLINLWTVVVTCEDGYFYADLGEEKGDIYQIAYKDKTYSLKKESAKQNNDTEENDDLGYVKKTKWSDLKIKLSGKEYSYPWNTEDFLKDGWESDTWYHEEQLTQIISPGNIYMINLDYPGYSCTLQLDIENKTKEDIKSTEATITKLDIGHWGEKQEPLFEFYGIKSGDKKDVAEKIFGTPENIYKDEFRGYYEYTYYSKIKNGGTASLVLTFNTKADELYELTISILDVEI